MLIAKIDLKKAIGIGATNTQILKNKMIFKEPRGKLKQALFNYQDCAIVFKFIVILLFPPAF